jgi:hypothetical protein
MTAITIPACPSWCILPADHETEFASDDGVSRGHSAGGPEALLPSMTVQKGSFYSVEMSIGSWEDIDADGTIAQSRPAAINLNSPSCELTADEAEAVADNLLALAARLREIQAQS